MAKFVIGSVLLTGIVGAFYMAANDDSKGKAQEVTLTQFKEMIAAKTFTHVSETRDAASGQITFIGRRADGKQSIVAREFKNKDIEKAIEDAGGFAEAPPIEMPAWWKGVLIWLLPSVLLLGGLIAWQNSRDKKHAKMMGNNGGTLTFGKSKAKLHEDASARKITFKDVAGVDEAKGEVEELVAFMKDPQKFQRMGGKLPRGLLLAGGPGLGKTLLAKAIAGEAKVPFFSISGSGFVEMFVGVGAARVRDMFQEAKKHGPCIIFIDEIDAMGRARGGVNSNDERESTLNQMLVEMDGFDDNSSILVIAATNRPDILDPALLRPGRFDRQVTLNLPDAHGRHQILKVHAKNKPMSKSVKLGELARELEGSSGADIANLLNEAALRAALRNAKEIHRADIDYALEKITLGAARTVETDPNEERNTAYHEAGHAIIAYRKEKICRVKVNKVSVTPRGRALGVTWTVSDKDTPAKFRDNLQGHISYLLGGRVAEILKCGQMTTGASNDLERVTDTARLMTMVYGMSPELPARNFAPVTASGRQNPPMSELMARKVDDAINKFVEDGEAEAIRILREEDAVLDLMADALCEFKTIDREDVVCIMEEKSMEKLRALRKKKDDEFKASVAIEEAPVLPKPPSNPNLWTVNSPPQIP